MAYKDLEKRRECKKKYYQEHKKEIREYGKKYSKKYYQKHKEEKKEYHKKYYQIYSQTLKGKLSTYKCSAKDRGFIWDLTFEQFKTFWQKPCYYCGSEIKTIGLDRIDNSKGYKIDNVVSCCMICNLMKRGLSKDIFVDYCKKISINN